MEIRIFYKFADIPDSNFLHNKIPIFASQNYADYLKELKNHNTLWFVYIENNKAQHILPFTISKRTIITKGYFLTGLISFDTGNSLEKENEFLNSAVFHIKKNKLCDWIQQSPNWALFDSIPSDSIAVRYGTYRILLENKNENELFNLIDRKCRQDINKAIRSGVNIKKGVDYLDDCLAVINYTAKEGNLNSLTSAEARKLLFYFKENLKIYVSYINDIPQSSEIFIGNEYCTYALYAGSIVKPFRGSTAYLYWEAIKDAKNNNSNYFDFVGARINPTPGSKVERIQKFKEHFGSEIVKGYIWKMVISEKKYNIYKIILKFYFLLVNKKMKKDIIDQELEKQNSEDVNSNS